MSWKAVDWATDLKISKSTTKFILILLANKADENFSCYPSIQTLMEESGAGRSTVFRAIDELEAWGYVTRQPRFHDSGAQRSTRYYLNHPPAPHLDPGRNPTLPRPDLALPSSHSDTPRVLKGHPPGVSNRDSSNPSSEPSTEPPTVTGILDLLSPTWRLHRPAGPELTSGLQAALARGWTQESLTAHLACNPRGVRHPEKVLLHRLAQLPSPPFPHLRSKPWCG
ncbi:MULTISPECIES: helix-turn-helix domain-containing protein [Mycobacteriaceae]|jgi:DNA-binding transcriptional MocR family regulator|uniref:helix-turn-helix domain-containing protein n=1 Tax=Mycolicibacterium TaxID=1866885 RepID=UPI0009F1E058|nr:MAG: helix-turn-helix domain-containing protein [Mycolicibacterium sp.]UCZ58921.1 helix-turn-helix domain-containing protein [Mycolicibacterium phocaicum]